ncbi:MAG: ribonuclease catalytic domain-containing protein [Pseudanabaenaceae cyanobacterium]
MDNSLAKGTLVEVRIHGDRRLTVVERPEGKKHLQVIDENGVTHVVHPREINFVVKGRDEDDSRYTPRQLPNFQAQVQTFLDPSSLEVAWELLCGETSLVTPTQMAQLLFSDVGAVTTYAAYVLLSNDKLYFKQKGDGYEPRSSAQVADLKHQAEAVQKRQLEAQMFQQKLRDALDGQQVTWSNTDRPKIDSLERYALHGDEASDKALAQDLLVSLDRPKNDQGALQLLIDLQVWNAHENLALLRSQVPTRFPNDVIAVTNTCVENAIPDSVERVDLTHLHVYTIDDASTTEIDDGLSIENLPDGRKRIWVHIADPTRWLEPDSTLDKEARRRGTSVYLPTGVIPMFPMELAAGPMSLIQGKVCHALSFAIELDDQGAAIYCSIHPSYIKPSYRLTYEDAEEMLQLGVEADLDDLADFARLRMKWRVSQGAIQINLPEATIKVNPDDPEQLTLEVLDELFSRQLVAEMMILTGEVAARFAKENNIPVPFRYQGTPELPPEELLQQLPPGPVREFAICRCMTKGEMGVYPARHAGLGLDAYTQVTSPIRRYGDLLAHWQFKAFVSGQPLPFTAEAINDLLRSVDPAVWEATQVERQTTRYWSLEYLRRHQSTVWDALFLDWLRESDRLGLVLLEDLGLKLPMRLNRAVPIGAQLYIKVADVDPRKDIIYFQEVHQEGNRELDRDFVPSHVEPSKDSDDQLPVSAEDMAMV